MIHNRKFVPNLSPTHVCLSVNDLIKVYAQLRIPPKSLFTSGDKLEMSCERPRHLTKHTASEQIIQGGSSKATSIVA
jgi:hypothetical protein